MNYEYDCYKPMKGPSTSAFTNRDGCLFDLSIPSKDDSPSMTVSISIRVTNVRHKSDKSTNAIAISVRSGCVKSGQTFRFMDCMSIAILVMPTFTNRQRASPSSIGSGAK